MVPAIVGANFTGAVVVFTLIAFVLPLPDLENEDAVLIVNLVVAGAYVIFACIARDGLGARRAGARRASGWSATAIPTRTSAGPHCACRCATCGSR